MLLDINPYHHRPSDCYECNIASIIKWKNKDCTLMFTNAWSFAYTRQPVSTREKLRYESDLIGLIDNQT